MKHSLRVLLVITTVTVLFMSGCKQQPSTGQGKVSDQKTDTISSIMAEADWARIDMLEENSPQQNFIDMKTYKPLSWKQVRFWHKVTQEDGMVLTHLYLDCQEGKYQILSSATFDKEGQIISQSEEQQELLPIVPDSNAEVLCVTLDPSGDGIIPKRDLPIIRELLRKGIRKYSQ